MNTPTRSGRSRLTASSPPMSRPSAITTVVCVALAAVVAAMSSLNVALPDIARATHGSQTQLSWIIDAYSLVFAALLLPAGALGDRYGRRRALLAGLAIFGAGSAVAMTASSATELIGLRAVLGLGAALVMPATLSTITGTFPPAQRTKAVSIWAGVAGGAAIIGVICSGALLEFFSWRSVFGLNVVLAVLAIIGTIRDRPRVSRSGRAAPGRRRRGPRGRRPGRRGLLHHRGAHRRVAQRPDPGRARPRPAASWSGSSWFELKQATPMLNPRIFTRRGLSAGSISIFVQFFAFFGFIFLVLQYLQIVRGDSAFIAAVSMLPLALTMMPASRLAPKAAATFGSRPVCVAGLRPHRRRPDHPGPARPGQPYWVLAAGLLVLGRGMGAAMTPATSAITSALPTQQQGVASAMNDLSREVGGALGIAVLGSIMTAIYRSHLTVSGVPAAVLGQARDSLAVASRIGGPVAAPGRRAFIDGIHVALLAAAAAAVLAAAAVAVLLPRRGVAVDTGRDTANPEVAGVTAPSA